MSSSESSSLAVNRIKAERKLWRKDHPKGFSAKPSKNTDGSSNLMKWNCKVPGKIGTPWAEGKYPVTIEFTDNYPSSPPKVSFPAAFFHPNVYPSGKVCLDIIGASWSASTTLKSILLGLQTLLNEPNPRSPANGHAARCFDKDKTEYNRLVKKEAAKYAKAA
eukprot:g1718.t1